MSDLVFLGGSVMKPTLTPRDLDRVEWIESLPRSPIVAHGERFREAHPTSARLGPQSMQEEIQVTLKL